jgi:hypothetical protein
MLPLPAAHAGVRRQGILGASQWEVALELNREWIPAIAEEIERDH